MLPFENETATGFNHHYGLKKMRKAKLVVRTRFCSIVKRFTICTVGLAES